MAMARDSEALEKQVSALSDALAHLATPEDWKHLIIILHRPGWTTPAEQLFASAILESFQAHTNALVALKGQLMKGAEAVGAK